MRERRRLSLPSRSACESILETLQALLGRKDARPGCVIWRLRLIGAAAPL